MRIIGMRRINASTFWRFFWLFSN